MLLLGKEVNHGNAVREPVIGDDAAVTAVWKARSDPES
jgi:hypothetical protein